MIENQNMAMVHFVTHLFRFMLVFRTNRFQVFLVTNTTGYALVGWADDYEESEEVQEVAWEV